MMSQRREANASAAPGAGIRVVVADRRALIADALASLISEGDRLTVVGVAGGELSVAAIIRARPDVVLIGLGDELAEALALVDALALRAPEAQVALVVDALSPSLVGCALDRGLGGLLLTSLPAADLVASIRRIARGQAILPSGWQAHAAREASDPVGALSGRQLEVLRLLADGCSYEEIGARLFISVNTVKFHMRSIFERLGVRNRIAAVRLLTDSTTAAR